MPLGVFLSGGLDSSVVVAEMTEIGARASTYSVGFEHESLDESGFARTVADAFSTDHHVLRPESDAPALLDALGDAYDEPFADSSALATLAVARAASEHVTVVLTGDGGDELFGGYERYRAMHIARHLRRRLGPLTGVAGRSAGLIGALPGTGRLAAAAGFVRDPGPNTATECSTSPQAKYADSSRPISQPRSTWDSPSVASMRCGPLQVMKDGRLGSTRGATCPMTC